MAKSGRNRKPYFLTPDGQELIGLVECPDGRFRPSGRSAPKWSPPWQLAFHKFQVWQAQQRGDLEPIDDPIFWQPDDRSKEYWREYFVSLIATDAAKAAVEMDYPPLALLADVDNLPVPAESMTLEEIGELYFNKRPTISREESKQSQRRWKQFRSIVKVASIADITQAHVDEYRDAIFGTAKEFKRAPSYVAKRFSTCKTIFGWADKLNKCPQHTKRIIALLTSLISPMKRRSLPTPISKDNLRTLLSVATDEERAMVLLGLNCGFYAADVRLLTRTNGLDLDRGVYAGYRAKTEIPQCSVLWKRTIAAAKKHLRQTTDNKSEFVFVSSVGTAYGTESFRRKIVRLCNRAKVKNVTFGNLRDGTASHSGTDLVQSNTLLGHKNPGIADAYALRHPDDVRKACETLEKYYFPKQPRGKK